LVSLALYLHECHVRRGDRPTQISNAEIWSALGWHQESLEQLDIYRDCNVHGPPKHSSSNSHFGSLRTFERLRGLCIQPEVLLGGCCGGLVAPFRLKDTLPPGLKSLTAYGFEELVKNERFGEQLKEVLDGEGFTCLKSVLLEEVSRLIPYFDPPVHLPHEQIEQACKERQVDFEVQRRHMLPKGGSGLPYFREAYRMRRHRERRLGMYSGEADMDPELDSDELDADLDVDELDTDELSPDELSPDEQSSDEQDTDEQDTDDG
jgi:hypothetical protein